MSLEEEIGQRLLLSKQTISTAESCTGGLIASRITDVSGSSAYMMGGVVAYSNDVKNALLKVKEQTLATHGAVSEQTAAEMAQGARQLLRSDYALSVTGIAGPGGGTIEKPVGLTYIGLAGPEDLLVVERYVWEMDRVGNKNASVDAAFRLLLQHLPA